MGVEGESLRELFKELLIDTKLIAEDKEEIKAALKDGDNVIIGSANSKLSIGTKIDDPGQLISSQGPTGLRLICLPKNLNKLNSEKRVSSNNVSNKESNQQKEGWLPLSSALILVNKILLQKSY